MKHLLKVSLIFLLFVIFSPVRILYSQWEYDGVFPDPTNPFINQTGGIHGLAVDPEGKIWSINYFAYDRDIIYVAADINQYIPVRAVYVFNPDGTQASFSPIKLVTIDGVTDTLGGFTNAYNQWEARTGRGMKMSPDGNIVVAMYDTYYKINYLTGEGMNKVTPVAGMTATAPAFSENGNMFTGPVLAGNPIKEFDENFNFLQDVVNPSIGFSRAFEVSGDGLTLYWAGYTNNCVYKYTRPDIFSSFNDYSIMLKGFAAESFAWYPNSDLLWISAGSGMDLPNQYPDTLTYYSYCTWYGYNISNNTITDSIKWTNLIDPYFQRPRAIAFSADGSAAYVGMFGNINYDGIQKFTPPLPVKVVRPNGGEIFSIGYTNTITWSSTVNNVKLEYSTDTGSNWNIIENSLPASIGQYDWLVPNTPSENSLVRISDVADPSVFDVSNNVFKISEPPVITVLPDSLNILLNEGDSIESIIQVSNSGLGNLYYDISIENIGDQSQKQNNSSAINFSNMWKESFLKVKENQNENSKASLPVNKQFESVLPLIISDPAGDASIVDIIQIRGRSTTDSIQLEFVFETDLNAYDFGGFLGLDIDQNILTGIPLPNGLYEQEVGCEFYIGLFGVAYGYIDLIDQYWNWLGSFPAEYDLRSFRFSIPLSSLSNDDGVMNIAAAVGTGSGPTDWIPDQGYGVLGGNLWLNVNPLSGTITPGNNEDISVKIKTNNIDGGEFFANVLISSNDPLNQQVTIPVHLTVIGQPDLTSTDSLNLGRVYVGYPKSVQIELKNNGSVTLEVSDIQSSNSVFSIQGSTNFNIEPLGTYQLSVLFSPVSASIEQGTISIISNDLSSPKIINLNGEGIFPPDITVSPDSFFYDLNVGDSIVTSLTIENSGLGDLNFQISDKLIASKISKKTHQNHLKHKNTSGEKNNSFRFDFKNLSKSNLDNKTSNKIFNSPPVADPLILLPIIVQDVIGDGGVADIKEIRGRIFNDNLEIEYVFADGINISDSLVAILFLDIDRDPFTGETDPYFHDLGVEYLVEYVPYYLGEQIYIYEYTTGYSYYLPYTVNGTTLSYSVPLAYLGNDDGEMDLVALSGDLNYPLDWAPDDGHVTLLKDVNWLSENPISGIVPPGENITIEISAKTSDLIGGNYFAAMDVQSNDPVNPVVEIPFTLHLTGIPQISVLPNSLNFGETYIGYHNSLVLSIESTGTDLLSGNINSSNPQFVVVDSVFELPVGEVKSVEVQFYPDALGIVSAELTITSNASSIPITISLTGEGVIAPNLITNTSLLEFQAGTGDTLRSNFMIYNTGGSDLVVDISDEVNSTTASERLFGAGNNMIYEIDPDNGLIINSFPTPSFTGYYSAGLAFSGEYLFFTDPDHTSNIFVLDPENGNIITYFPTNSTYCDGLAYIDPYLYVRDNNNNSIKVLNPTNGNVVRVIYPQVYLYGGLDGGNNRLFASDGYTVYELNPQNGSVLNSFYVNNGAYGLGFTGERLFTSVSWAGIDQYDPNTGSFIRNISSAGYAGLAGGGKRDAKWLTENPENVTISAGDSVAINLSLITPSELGHYTADIILESNDPDLLITQLQVVLDVVTGVEEVNFLPTVYSLYNNYPNPFNPTTTIKYDIPEQSYVTIKIYTIVGEEVTTLLNEEQTAGRYQIQWNASELASGVYFYRIQAGQFSDTKKLILMK